MGAIQRDNWALMEIANKIEKKKRKTYLKSRTREVPIPKQLRHKTQEGFKQLSFAGESVLG